MREILLCMVVCRSNLRHCLSNGRTDVDDIAPARHLPVSRVHVSGHSSQSRPRHFWLLRQIEFTLHGPCNIHASALCLFL
jgi:hypothetical protein